MGEVQWIKLYIDMFDKRKINKLRRLPDGDRILLFWVMLLATAGKCNAGGMIYITERVPFAKEDLADEFGFDLATVELALKAFVEYDMIDIYDGGFISVRNWEEYQNTDRLAEIREYNRLAKQKSREKQKALKDVIDMSMTCQSCQDIEEDKEKDKEKETHSFNLTLDGEETKDAAKRRYLGGSLGKGVVLLSDDQIDKLLDELSIEEFDHYVSVVAKCELDGKGYKRKTHYQAIRDMALKDRQKGS